jgi:pteridine reductase
MINAALEDKVALVTGGAHRLGAAVARVLHAHGMKLVVHYHASEVQAHVLQKELNAARPDSVLLVRGDLALGDKLARNLVFETVERFGRLDALVNNAARFFPTPVGGTTEAQWDELVNTNLKAPFLLSQAAAPHLRDARGCIVNVADIYGERPLAEHTVYSLTKAGIVMLTKSLARELAPEVRVNAIAPGAILWPERPMDEMAKQRILSKTLLKRVGDPADIATTVLYLVRDAVYVTGQVFAVDGGRSTLI